MSNLAKENCRACRGAKGEENLGFIVFQTLLCDSRPVHHHGPLMGRERKGGDGGGREYRYEFFYLMGFMGDCISEGCRSQGSWKSEEEIVIGQLIKARREITALLHIGRKEHICL